MNNIFLKDQKVDFLSKSISILRILRIQQGSAKVAMAFFSRKFWNRNLKSKLEIETRSWTQIRNSKSNAEIEIRNSKSKHEIEARIRNSKSQFEIQNRNSKLEIKTRNQNSKSKFELEIENRLRFFISRFEFRFLVFMGFRFRASLVLMFRPV